MSLQEWVRNGWVSERKSTRQEIQSSYEMGGTISEKEGAEMAAFAADLRQRVERWVREKHPELKL